MKEYQVTFPISGSISLIVEAENEKKAKENFFDEYNKIEKEQGINSIKDFTFEFHDKIVEGNIFHGELNEVYIEEIKKE